MNYKQFLTIYNQGPDEVYRLLKKYEKRIESLGGQLQVISDRMSTLEFQSKKTLQIAISHLHPMDSVNRKQRVYAKKRTGRQVVNRDIKDIPFTIFLILTHVIRPHVTTCDCCGESLENEPVVRVKIRQVYIPPI